MDIVRAGESFDLAVVLTSPEPSRAVGLPAQCQDMSNLRQIRKDGKDGCARNDRKDELRDSFRLPWLDTGEHNRRRDVCISRYGMVAGGRMDGV